ncbi:MAG: hypothetical protein EGQ34_08310 [Sutterella sp.]|nr:hypothetical protein [Sutterella sp.]
MFCIVREMVFSWGRDRVFVSSEGIRKHREGEFRNALSPRYLWTGAAGKIPGIRDFTAEAQPSLAPLEKKDVAPLEMTSFHCWIG